MANVLGFIGCGNMGGALVRAALKTVDASKIIVCDFNASKTKAFVEEYGVKTLNAKGVALSAKYIVLGVKPQNMQDTVNEIAPLLTNYHVLITMAAGISMQAIRSFAGKNLPVIRIMPNTPAQLGEGMILYSCLGVDENAEKAFLNYFQKAGVLDKLPEDKMDGASALSGCGPAYVYAFVEALVAGTKELGISEDKALLYATQTLVGAGEMLKKFGNPEALRIAVCSPGGTTLAGLDAMEKKGFTESVKSAVKGAYARTLELKK
jgi:pyrroline-5-carboxylate reductase